MAGNGAVLRNQTLSGLSWLLAAWTLAGSATEAYADATSGRVLESHGPAITVSQARPPVTDLNFFIFNPTGNDIASALNSVAAVQSHRGGRFFVGKANGAALDQVVKLGYAPTYLSNPTRFDPPAGAGGSLEGFQATETAPDTDGDGLSDADELVYHTDPSNPDSDQDFLSDGDEVHLYGTWPLKESTDGDRYDDGQEILGYSPAGLGALGGDMPGYVLAPGDQPLVAAYPKIDFEVRDGVEMQAREQVTIGTKTITTETKSKETSKRTVDSVEVGGAPNLVQGNQQVDDPTSMTAHEQASASQPGSVVSAKNSQSAALAATLINTRKGTNVDAGFAAECNPSLASCVASPFSGIFDPATPTSTATQSLSISSGTDGYYKIGFDPITTGLYDRLGVDSFDKVLTREKLGENITGDVVTVVGFFGDLAGRGLPVSGLIGTLQTAKKHQEAAKSDNYALAVMREDSGWVFDQYILFKQAQGPMTGEIYRVNDLGRQYLASYKVLDWWCFLNSACSLAETALGAKSKLREAFGGRPLPFTSHKQLEIGYFMFVPTDLDKWHRWNEHLRCALEIAGQGCPARSMATTAATPLDERSPRVSDGPFGVSAHLSLSTTDFGTGVIQAKSTTGGLLSRSIVFEDANEEGDEQEQETSRRIPVKTFHLEETVITETYSWSVTKEDWQTVTTDSTDFGTVTFSFNVRNTGTDIAQDASGLRFNLYIGDNPATTEVENFNPVTFPSIQNPAITFQNVAPGDEMLFGATLHLAKQQFRALDEGASLKIAVADYSYGSDELYYRSAAGGGVRLLLDNGVLAPAESRHQEFLVPVEKVWDETLGALRDSTYGELLAKVVAVEHQEGILKKINGRSIGGSAWWSMMLTKATDASLFYRSTAVKGQTVRLEYHGDQDGDGYADAVEQEYGTDPEDASAHPSPVVIGALFESPDPVNPGWTIGRFKVANTGTYEAYGMEARIYATDVDVEIADALVGGSGLVKPRETFDHPDDVFRYRSTSGRRPLLEIRYNDPTGLKILLSTVTVTSLSDDISGYAAQMRTKSRITAEAPETFFYDAAQKLTVGYTNPTTTSVRAASFLVDWQSLAGNILKHENRTLDLSPGSSFASFDFKPQDHLSPVNIGGRFKALVRVLDHNGALIDSRVAYMVVFPRKSEVSLDGAPQLALSGSPWVVGSVTRGTEKRHVLVLSNTGHSTLEASVSTSSKELRFAGDTVLAIPPGGQVRMPVVFDSASASVGLYSAGIHIGSNDPSDPEVLVPVTATILEPTSTVSLFPVDGRPWERRVFVNGSYPAGTKLFFDHDIPGETDRVHPLLLFDSTRTIELAHSAESDPVNATLRRTGLTQTQCEMVVPNDTGLGATYILQFGKREEQDLFGSNVLTLSARIPHELTGGARLALWQHVSRQYDEFDDGTIDLARWVTTPNMNGGAVTEANGVIRLAAEQYVGGPGTWTATSTIDAKIQNLDVIWCSVAGGSLLQMYGDPGAEAFFAIGSIRIETFADDGHGIAIPAHLLRVEINRIQETAKVFRDDQWIGDFDLSTEPTWRVVFGVWRAKRQDLAWLEVDWVRAARNSRVFSVRAGSDERIVWEGGSEPVDWNTVATSVVKHLSPDFSGQLNAALAMLPVVDGQSDLPLFCHTDYQGWTLLTDLRLAAGVLPAVNLRAASLAVPGTVRQGQLIRVELTVQNTGGAASGSYTCSFYSDAADGTSSYFGSAIVPSGLQAGEIGECSATGKLEAAEAELHLRAKIDPSNDVLETDESDNEATVSTRVLAPARVIADCASWTITPAAPVQWQGASIKANVVNLGEETASGVLLEIFDGTPGGGGLLVGRVRVDVAAGGEATAVIPWLPLLSGARILYSRLVLSDADGSLSTPSGICAIGPIHVSPGVGGTAIVDSGDEGLPDATDTGYDAAIGFGYLDGLAEITWGTLPWQSYRYGFGGVVRYRFDNLSPAATYHLDSTFFEGDGVGRTVEVWVDGENTGRAVNLAGGQIHRLSVTLPRAAYAADGSTIVEFRRQGPGDVLVNVLSLRRVESWYVDSGDGGVTDHAYSTANGYGFLNGSGSTAWGASPAQSIRYGLTGDVKYRFTNLDPTKRYRVSTTLFEADGQGRVEQVEIDGIAVGTPVTLSATAQVASGLVPVSAYASDRSIDVRVFRTNGSQAVVSEITLEEETLPVRTLSASSVTPAAGTGSTPFTYEVEYTDLDGTLPDDVTVTIDGAPYAMAATDPGVTDTRRGRRYAYSTTGLSNGLHSYAFSASVGGEAATGDVLVHVGPLVGGPGLPDTGAWGLIPAGDTTHPSEVLYAFGPLSKPVRLGFEVYDVDLAGEVEVFLNGTSLGFVPTTADGQWGGAQELILPRSALRSVGGNQLAFRNTVNQPTGSEPWGVRNVSLLAERPEGLAVDDVAADDGTAVIVRWTLSVDDGAGLGNVLGYRVYRGTAPEGPFALVHTALPGTALWVDAGVVCETRYWYRVAAYNGLQDSSTPLMEDATPLDNRAPAVLGASPVAGATGVPAGTPIVLHLVDTGRGVDETSIDVRVNGAYVNPTLAGTPADLTATIVPPALAAGSSVTVTLSAADRAMPPNKLEGYGLGFTTGQDATTPYLFTPSPGAGATGVDPNVVISVQVRDDGSGVDASSVVLRVNGIQVTPVSLADGGNVTLTYDPPSAFAAGQVVTVAVSARDLAPVPNVLSATWSFTVANGGEGPVITSSSPESAPVSLEGATVPFVVTTQDDTLDLTTVTWRVDGTVTKTGTTFNGSGGGDWSARRPVTLSGGATAYTDEWVSLALGAHSSTPSDYLVHDDFASLNAAWTGFNTTPGVSGGTLNVTTSSTDLSGSVDTYPFVYRPISQTGDWTAEVQTTCTNNATSDGCGLLVRVDADNWYFVGQAWDAGLAADSVTFRFQTGGMSMVSLPVAQATATVLLRLVKTGNLLYASYRLNTSSAWTSLGSAPIFATSLQVGMAAWETTATAITANFDTFRCSAGTTLPITTLLSGAKPGFGDIRITEENGSVQSLVPVKLTDANFDGVNDTATFPADATAANTWKTYRVYYGNPSAADLSTATPPGANAFAEPAPVIGSSTAVTGTKFDWAATPTGTRTIEAQASDGTSSDYRTWAVTVESTTPGAPSGLAASPDDGRVHLSWVASSAANVAGYNVYRNGVKVNGALLTVAAYSDTGLANGVSRCWTVRAVSPGAVESLDSNQVCAAPRDRVAPAAPVGLAVEPRNASAQLAWYPGWAPDLAGYKVYRKLHSATTFTLATVSAVAAPAWLDESLVNGTAYDWAVTALDTSGNESDLSAAVTASPRVPPPVEVSVGDAVVLEGHSGAREAVFSVTLSRAPGAAVGMSWATAAGTAAAGTDFTSASGSLSFGASETLKTITVLVTGDNFAEESETFFVNLSGVSGATFFDAEGMGTILNDDVQVPLTERAALIALYDATNGSGWTVRTNWRNQAGTDFNPPGTECTWLGVTCDPTRTHVTALDLSANHLVGTIPSALGNLPALVALSLRSNQLTGPVPGSLGSLASLRTLDLGMNGGLTGPIPASFASLTRLEQLLLRGNQLDGEIPTAIGALPALKGLDLSSNRFTGALPVPLGQLTGLETLDLGFNLFDPGPFPEWIQNLAALRQLGLSKTSRTGTLPAWVGTLTELRLLAVDGNSLEGTLPSSIGSLAKLEQLQIGGNTFAGSIPGAFVNLTSLAGSASELRWNGLQTSDGALRAFLNSKQRQGGNWEGTQTVAPANLGVLSATANSVSLAWSPITYTDDPGGYEVLVGTQPGGPYTLAGTTVNKTTAAGSAEGLQPGRTYYFVVRSKTDPHANNPNTVRSLVSSEVSVATACVPLPVPVLTVPASVKTGSTFTASVPANAGSSYAWGITNGSIGNGQGSHEITVTAGDVGTLVLRVVETGGTGCVSPEGSASVAVTLSDATNPGISCKTIHAESASSPSALYWIDPNGPPVVDAFLAYCDMTTDGGGWTLAVNSVTGSEPASADAVAVSGTAGPNSGHTINATDLALSQVAEIRHRIWVASGMAFDAKYKGTFHAPLAPWASWTALQGHVVGSEMLLPGQFTSAWVTSGDCATTWGTPWYYGSPTCVTSIPLNAADGATQGPVNTAGETLTRYSIFVRELCPPLSSVAVGVTGSTTLCPGTTGGTATVTDTNGGSASHQWGYRTISGGTIVPIAAQTATTYLINAVDFGAVGSFYLVCTTTPTCGATMTSNEVAVTVNAASVPTITPSGPTTFCAGGSVTLTASAGTSYLWSPGAQTTPSIVVSTAGSYSVTVMGSGCTGTSAATVVTVKPIPSTPTATANSPICEGGTVELGTATVTGATYSWTGPNSFASNLPSPTIPNATLAAAGTYSLTVTVDGCPSAAGSTVVVVNPKPVMPSITAPASAIAGATGLTASVPPNVGSTYAWTLVNGTITGGEGSNQVTFTAGVAGSLEIRVVETSGAGCVSAQGSVTVPVIPSGATRFHTLVPCRVLDTRSSSGADAASPALDGGEVRTFDLTGRCGILATAKALSVNVTITGPAADGDLVVYRGDLTTPPISSNVSFRAGRTRANNGLVELAQDGSLTIKVHNRAAGPVHLIFDVNGTFE